MIRQTEYQTRTIQHPDIPREVRVIRAWPGVQQGQVLTGLRPERIERLLKMRMVEPIEPEKPKRRKRDDAGG